MTQYTYHHQLENCMPSYIVNLRDGYDVGCTWGTQEQHTAHMNCDDDLPHHNTTLQGAKIVILNGREWNQIYAAAIGYSKASPYPTNHMRWKREKMV